MNRCGAAPAPGFLVADDDEAMRNLFRAILARRFPGCRIQLAACAATALAAARDSMPDLAILDVRMPGGDGISLCRQMRADPLTADMAILMCSGYADAENRTAAFDSGAEGFITKPFTDLELVAQIRAILRAHQCEDRMRAAVREQVELIARLRQTEEALREAKAIADQASEAKSVLLAGVSHETRTPMNSILGFAQALELEYFGPLNDRQREYVGNILTRGYHLLRMIDRILDIAAIDASIPSLDLSDGELAGLVADAAIVAQEQCTRRGIDLEFVATAQPLTVHTDLQRLKQIVSLLLSNAVKFTPTGGRIRVVSESRGATLQIAVEDTGAGLDPDDLDRVFAPFFQAGVGRSDKTPGNGLGLALVQRLARLCGGSVYGESEGLGKGSRFVLTIPRCLKTAPLPIRQTCG